MTEIKILDFDRPKEKNILKKMACKNSPSHIKDLKFAMMK